MKRLLSIAFGLAAALTLAACSDPNAEGGSGDQLAALVAADLGLDPEDIRRATKEEIESRLSNDWETADGEVRFGTFSVEGERGQFLHINGKGSIGRWSSKSDQYFTVESANDDGTIDIRFHSGEICLSQGGSEARCARSSSGSGTMTMYLSDAFPRAIGLYINYRTNGRGFRLNSSNRFSGEARGEYGVILER